ncbi:MAG: hypothetical protein OEN56_06525 [Gemmatimonadota bacterium]|nr:hypothetical protein [Gemmatimonadota bacterium]
MFHSKRDPIRLGTSAVIALLMLTLSVAVPVIEQGALFDRPVVEAEHEPGDCPSGHDHTVCTQVGANLAFEGHLVERPMEGPVLAVAAFTDERATPARGWDRSNRSRAPPLG